MIAENITIGTLIVAALLDSINPCVFGVLIFLIAFMNTVFKSKRMMLLGGLLYTGVVYITYFLLGLLLLNLAINTGFAALFYLIAALIAILAGLFEIKDYFWYGKGFSLQMLPGGAERIKYYTAKIEKLEKKHPSVLLLSTALLGVFVVFVELPCTGAPYLAVLALVSHGLYAKAIPLLLLYNFIFVLPLFVIIMVAYFGTTSETLENWRKENKGLMRLGVGLFLLALGVYMLFNLPPIF